MSTDEDKNIKFKVPSEVAKIMKQWGGKSVKLAAARGALPMSGPNLVVVLFMFYYGPDEELQSEALNTLKELSPSILKSVCSQPDIHPEVLDLLGRLHFKDMAVMEPLLTNRMVGFKTLNFVAEHASGDVLELLSHNDVAVRQSKTLRTLIINNPHAEKVLKLRLGWKEPAAEKPDSQSASISDTLPAKADQGQAGFDAGIQKVDTDGLSKYQQVLDMQVSEKIKMALTGDKEWRSLLIRESNKLVSSAVLKNPRITEAEVLMVAKNRASNDDLIRLIVMNREWVKNYDMKKALIEHPRTPLQSAMRFMSFLTEKDTKELAKSRNVSQAIVNNARRMLINKKH